MANPKYPLVYDNTLGNPFKMSLSTHQKRLLMHALGLTEEELIVTRNHFSADKHHIDLDRLELLVRKGLMVNYPSSVSKDMMFYVTDRGRQALADTGLKFTNLNTEFPSGQ